MLNTELLEALTLYFNDTFDPALYRMDVTGALQQGDMDESEMLNHIDTDSSLKLALHFEKVNQIWVDELKAYVIAESAKIRNNGQHD